MHKNVRGTICCVILLTASLIFIWVLKQFSDVADKPATGDLATWAGAIGTVAAVFAAINISIQEHKRMRTREWDIAVVHASGLYERLMACKNLLEVVREHFEKDASTSKLPQSTASMSLSFALTHLGNMPHYSSEELEKIVPIPNNVAAHLAASKDRIETCKIILRAAQRGLFEDGVSLENFAYSFLPMIETPRLSYTHAMNEIQLVFKPLNMLFEAQ